MSSNPLLMLGFLIPLFALSCSKGETSSRSVLPPTSMTPQSSATSQSPIRILDFDNLAYPNFPDYSRDQKRRITLKPGEGGPNLINYGDITGDGSEDAMVVLGISSRGSAVADYVYIFTLENGKPKLIWDFETGDRADGGLRNVYAENGQLVIELFGKDRVVGGQLYRGEEGLCCPSSFTRARYHWAGKHFEMTTKEVLENPGRGANRIMPRYEPKK